MIFGLLWHFQIWSSSIFNLDVQRVIYNWNKYYIYLISERIQRIQNYTIYSKYMNIYSTWNRCTRSSSNYSSSKREAHSSKDEHVISIRKRSLDNYNFYCSSRRIPRNNTGERITYLFWKLLDRRESAVYNQILHATTLRETIVEEVAQ